MEHNDKERRKTKYNFDGMDNESIINKLLNNCLENLTEIAGNDLRPKQFVSVNIIADVVEDIRIALDNVKKLKSDGLKSAFPKRSRGILDTESVNIVLKQLKLVEAFGLYVDDKIAELEKQTKSTKKAMGNFLQKIMAKEQINTPRQDTP